MGSLLFLQNLGTGEILIIVVVALLLFGGNKIPEVMRSLGKGVRSFKDGVADIEKEIASAGTTTKADSSVGKKPAASARAAKTSTDEKQAAAESATEAAAEAGSAEAGSADVEAEHNDSSFDPDFGK